MAQDAYKSEVGEYGSLVAGVVTLSGALEGFRTFAAASHTVGNTIPVLVLQVTNNTVVKSASYLATYAAGSLTLGVEVVESALGKPVSGTVEVYEQVTDTDVNLGRTSLQSSDIGTSVQAYSAVLDATTESYTTAEKTKLDGIEAGATADQTGEEIKLAYEAEADTNAFTDAEKTKLAGIETAADVTDAINVAAAGALMKWTVSTHTPTTGNINAVANTWHRIDQSSQTADVSFTVQSGTAGQRSRVQISTGDDTYDIDITADTGVTIKLLKRSATAAVITQLYTTGEYLDFYWVDATTVLVEDGRIPGYQRIEADGTNAQTAGGTSGWTWNGNMPTLVAGGSGFTHDAGDRTTPTPSTLAPRRVMNVEGYYSHNSNISVTVPDGVRLIIGLADYPGGGNTQNIAEYMGAAGIASKQVSFFVQSAAKGQAYGTRFQTPGTASGVHFGGGSVNLVMREGLA